MIVLSTKIDTNWRSKDARLIIRMGLFCSTVTNNRLSYFSVNLDLKTLYLPVFLVIAMNPYKKW